MEKRTLPIAWDMTRDGWVEPQVAPVLANDLDLHLILSVAVSVCLPPDFVIQGIGTGCRSFCSLTSTFTISHSCSVLVFSHTQGHYLVR
jgi:hypothetical protein